jgi:hypothetical protein
LAHEECIGSEDADCGTNSEENNMGVNMVFELSSEFCSPEREVAELALGAKVAAFEKPKKLWQHMIPLFVRGYVEGRLVQ